MGYVRPACVGFQIDKYGRKNGLFSIMGHNVQLTDFIDEVESYCNEILPKIVEKMDILPHDANRKYDVSPHSALDIFTNKGLKADTIYVKRDMSHAQVNDELKKFTKGEPMLRLDSKHCNLLAQCLAGYTRHENTGQPRKDNYYEHISDAFKLGCFYVSRKLNQTQTEPKEPQYFGMQFGDDRSRML